MLACLTLTGCSGLVRNFVNTQPRVELSQDDYSDPSRIVKGDAVVYVPEDTIGTRAGIDPDLVKFAPIIVQGVEPKAGGSTHYDPNDDAIGSPRLIDDDTGVRIDTSDPRLYTRVEHATVGDTQLKQLVYALWYPSHPAGSIESGEIDGGVLRITLDQSGHPTIFEYTQPCGCFHGVFVSDALEAEALAQFSSVPPHRKYAVEPPLTGHDDWVVRDTVKIVPDGRPALYISAGAHACEAIRDLPPGSLEPAVSSRRAYALAPYDALDHVPDDAGGSASIFDEQGLVLGARRSGEQFLLADLDHAGWPRRLDTMLIHWDADQWTDPTLLDAHLRLPSTIASQPTSPLASAATPPATPTPVATPDESSGPHLVLFTNAHCLGCQQTKRFLTESPGVRAALEGWQWKVVDTLTPEGERLAAQTRVTSVPVLIGYDHGHEIFRADDIETPAKLASIIRRHALDARSTRASLASGS
jgi:hypothetical protein